MSPILELGILTDQGTVEKHSAEIIKPSNEKADLSEYQLQKWERVKAINKNIQIVIDKDEQPEQRGKAWREALYLGSTDPKRLREAEQIFNSSLSRFESKGEKAIGEIYRQELNELGKTNFDLALAVKEGVVSREAALIITKVYGKHLSHDQMLELAEAFVARGQDETLEDFEKRRQRKIADLKEIDGMNKEETWTMKRKVQDLLEIYNMLEVEVTKKSSWPKRRDGQIRRSFIKRSEVLDEAILVLKDINSCFNLKLKREEIENGAKIPNEIPNLQHILDIVEERGDVKAVTFDMFDTLVQWTSNHHERHILMNVAASRELKKFGITIPAEEFEQIRNSIWYPIKKVKSAKGEEFQALEVLTKVVQEVAKNKRVNLSPSQIKEAAENLELAFIGVDSDTAVPMPGAVDVLRKLRQKGVKVAVISNHPYNEHSVKLLLRKFGLLKYLDNVVVSSSIGYLKSPADPNANIFKATLKDLGVKPGEVLHIGDNYEADQMAPKAVGIRGVVYNNSRTTQKNLEARSLKPNSSEYKRASLEAYREASSLNAKSYFDGQREKYPGISEEMERYATRFHEISRDYYAPLMIKFAEDNLQRLQSEPGMINLCVGRDGLASFLVQRKLIELFPDKYSNVDPKRIQYTSASRLLVEKGNKDSLRAFLEPTGFNQAKKINIVDNGIAGSTQDGLVDLFPDKDIEGSYLLSRKFRDDPNRHKKRGLVVEVDSTRESGTKGLKVRGVHDQAFIGGKASPDIRGIFMTADFVHTQEDVWNGIFDSSQPLITTEKGEVRPENKFQKMSAAPGNPDAIPALNPEGYLVLKKLGLKGIMDGIHMYRRKTQLSQAYSIEESIRVLAEWFKRANDDKKGGLDNELLRAMVRLKV